VLRGEDASWILSGLSGALDARADLEGGLKLTVPMAYLEATRVSGPASGVVPSAGAGPRE